MSSTDVSGKSEQAESALGVDMDLEVVTLPVADVDRAKAFYQSLGWRLDIDLVVSDEVRSVQFTPPDSGCSIRFGKGRTAAEPGSAQAMILAVKDIDAARGDLIIRGIDVSAAPRVALGARPAMGNPPVCSARRTAGHGSTVHRGAH